MVLFYAYGLGNRTHGKFIFTFFFFFFAFFVVLCVCVCVCVCVQLIHESFYTQLYDIKYSSLIEIIATHLYSFN